MYVDKIILLKLIQNIL
jgi:hypothetical protein